MDVDFLKILQKNTSVASSHTASDASENNSDESIHTSVNQRNTQNVGTFRNKYTKFNKKEDKGNIANFIKASYPNIQDDEINNAIIAFVEYNPELKSFIDANYIIKQCQNDAQKSKETIREENLDDRNSKNFETYYDRIIYRVVSGDCNDIESVVEQCKDLCSLYGLSDKQINNIAQPLIKYLNTINETENTEKYSPCDINDSSMDFIKSIDYSSYAQEVYCPNTYLVEDYTEINDINDFAIEQTPAVDIEEQIDNLAIKNLEEKKSRYTQRNDLTDEEYSQIIALDTLNTKFNSLYGQFSEQIDSEGVVDYVYNAVKDICGIGITRSMIQRDFDNHQGSLASLTAFVNNDDESARNITNQEFIRRINESDTFKDTMDTFLLYYNDEDKALEKFNEYIKLNKENIDFNSTGLYEDIKLVKENDEFVFKIKYSENNNLLTDDESDEEGYVTCPIYDDETILPAPVQNFLSTGKIDIENTDFFNPDMDFNDAYRFWTGVEYSIENIENYNQACSLYTEVNIGLLTSQNKEQALKNLTCTDAFEYFKNSCDDDEDKAIQAFNDYYGYILSDSLKSSYPEELQEINSITVQKDENGEIVFLADVKNSDLTVLDSALFCDLNNFVAENGILEKDFIDSFQEEKNITVQEAVMNYNNAFVSVFGTKNNEMETVLNKYIQDMDSYAQNLSAALSMGFIGLSFVCPAFGFGAMGSAFLDNTIDAVNMVSNKKEGEDWQTLAKNTKQELINMAIGMMIGCGANQLHGVVSDKLVAGGATARFASVIGTGTEVAADASLGILYDYLSTGDMNLTGNGLSVALDIVSGVRGYHALKSKMDAKPANAKPQADTPKTSGFITKLGAVFGNIVDAIHKAGDISDDAVKVKPEADVDATVKALETPTKAETDVDATVKAVETPTKAETDVTAVPKAPDTEAKIKLRIYSETVENLIKSIDDIPHNIDKRREFIRNFFQTDLKTGVQKEFEPSTISEMEEVINTILKYSDDDLALVLKHGLKTAEIFGNDCINYNYCRADISIYRQGVERNIYGLIDQAKTQTEIYNIGYLGALSDIDYARSCDLMQKIGMDISDDAAISLMQFVGMTNQDTIDYMVKNNLFDPNNLTGLKKSIDDFSIKSIFYSFARSNVTTVKSLHQRGLLQEISGRILSFDECIKLADELTDEQWNNIKRANLLTLKINGDKYLSIGQIFDFAKLDADTLMRIDSRAIADKVGFMTENISNLAQLNDADWQKILDRNIPVDKIDFADMKKLTKILSLSDSEWKIAQKRGLAFICDQEYMLLELSDERWETLIKRESELHLSTNPFSAEDRIRLSELTDEEFETAKKRKLIYNPPDGKYGYSFSNSDLLAAKLSDSEYSLYIERGLEDVVGCNYGNLPNDIKMKIINMTEAEYARLEEVRKATQFNHLSAEGDLYKLAYIDNEDEFYLALYLLEYNTKAGMGEKDVLNFDEINRIIKSPEDKIIGLLKAIRLEEFLDSESDNQFGSFLWGGDLVKHDIKTTNKHILFSKEAMFKIMELDDVTCQKIAEAQDYLLNNQIEGYIKDGSIATILNSKAYAKNKNIIVKVNELEKVSEPVRNIIVNKLLGITNDYTNMTLREKMQRIEALQEIQETQMRSVFDEEEIKTLNLDDEILKLQNSIKHVIATTDVSQESAAAMMRGFFANNNPELDNLLSRADFSRYEKEGLPLTYPRKSFVEDLSKILLNASEDEQEEILKKLGITLFENNGKITGYDGIIDLTSLSDTGIEGDILTIATKFIRGNSVKTGNDSLDEALNSLIQGMPEFINIIGKQQHSGQSYSLDIHILNVLKGAMANPEYENLKPDEKFCLKIAAILHDIAKPEGVDDPEHASLCALYARDILYKDSINMPDEYKDRIYELVKNHHWLKDYNTGAKSAYEVAASYRREGDLAIARILAEADLAAVDNKGEHYQKFIGALDEPRQQPINDALARINQNGQLTLASHIANASKIPTVEYNGKKYQLINFTQLDGDADLSQLGFAPGTTVDNLRLFMHAVADDSIGDLENVICLSDPSYQGFLCATFGSIKNHQTYCNYKYGVILDAEGPNIANGASKNQFSGCGKNFLGFINIITASDPSKKFRTLIPNDIKIALGLSDSEYSELYGIIQNIKFPSQLDKLGTISIGDKTFSADEIKKAIFNADDLMIDKNPDKHSEVNLYTPKTEAVFAKVNSMEEVPQELLDFAQKYNLPIFILGK